MFAAAPMEGFFNTLKSSGLVEAVKDLAMDALHLDDNDEKKKGSSDVGLCIFHVCLSCRRC